MIYGLSCLHCRYCDKVIGSSCHCQSDLDTPQMYSFNRANHCSCYNEMGYIHPLIMVYSPSVSSVIIHALYEHSQLSLIF